MHTAKIGCVPLPAFAVEVAFTVAHVVLPLPIVVRPARRPVHPRLETTRCNNPSISMCNPTSSELCLLSKRETLRHQIPGSHFSLTVHVFIRDVSGSSSLFGWIPPSGCEQTRRNAFGSSRDPSRSASSSPFPWRFPSSQCPSYRMARATLTFPAEY